MGNGIKRIYTGLPKKLADQVLWVERKFRVNELSYQPGGFDVVVEYSSGKVFGYDWIKRPSQYIGRILQTEAEESEEHNYDFLDESHLLQLAKRLVSTVHGKRNAPSQDKAIATFQEIWNSATSKFTLTEALRKFEEEVEVEVKVERLVLVQDPKPKQCKHCKKDIRKCSSTLNSILDIEPDERKKILDKMDCVADYHYGAGVEEIYDFKDQTDSEPSVSTTLIKRKLVSRLSKIKTDRMDRGYERAKEAERKFWSSMEF